MKPNEYLKVQRNTSGVDSGEIDYSINVEALQRAFATGDDDQNRRNYAAINVQLNILKKRVREYFAQRKSRSSYSWAADEEATE